MNKLEIYNQLKEEVLSCKKCDLGLETCFNGLNPHVTGQGNLDSKVMFVAQNPGENECRNKQPLTSTGKSGKVYENVLASLGLSREQVYTTNSLLCYTPKNAEPEPYQMKSCSDYLVRQLELVKPELVVAFGRFASQVFLSDFKITRDHGKILKSEKFGVDVFSMYHPAYFLAYSSLEHRKEFKADLQTLKTIITNIYKGG